MSERACVLSHRGITPRIDPEAYLAPGSTVVGDVQIGPGSSLWFGTVVRGDVHFIRIGARTNLQDGTVVHVTTDEWPAVLEDDVVVGHRAVLHGCHVSSGALIGVGSIILDGAAIGEGAQVAAGALVPPGMQVPPRTLVVGLPAKVRRELRDEEVAEHAVLAERYVGLAERYRGEVG